MNYCKDDDMKWQDRMTMFAMAIVLLASAAAFIGMAKKEIVTNDIVEFDVESILIDDPIPLPEIDAQEAALPEILPPLFNEPLPPLQGEV